MDENGGYSFQLDQKYRKMASEHLRETDFSRPQALEQFREWIFKHPYIKSCRTDDKFLLCLLRKSKFSVLDACSLLETLMQARQAYPQWFMNLSLNESKIESLLDDGYIVPLSKRGENGQQIVLYRIACVDPLKYTSTDLVRAQALVFQTVLNDEETQVAGITFVLDQAGLSWEHMKMYTLSDVRILLTCFQKASPMRTKHVYVINSPTFALKFSEFAESLLGTSLKSKYRIMRDYEHLKEIIDPKLLPKEHGGEESVKDLISKFKKKIMVTEDDIRSKSDLVYELPSGKKNWIEQTLAENEGMCGSFRKLEID